MSQSEDLDEEIKDEADTFKILIATDNHLGYNEKDPIRGEDSFIAFEEILEIAVREDVDFILLGGDLFHDATPSQNALNKCIKSLKRVVLGDKPISFEFLSDQSVNFMDSLNQTVNYEDPNINISIPVFSIHGNHDDPSGFGRLSSLDILSSTGLINYFGKWLDLTKIIINPIMLKKGVSQLAIYGLSHIHDARLARLFRESKVVMGTPTETTDEWFNLMVLHQNRADRGPTNYLPEEILPSFLDLIIWGHEHDCRICPEISSNRKSYISQPGSSVQTSLSAGEALQKNCGILKVYKNNFNMESFPLQTVRPFVFDSIEISDYEKEYKFDEGTIAEKVMKLAEDKIEEMIVEAERQISDDHRQPKLPLIRLRLVYSNENQMFNAIRFGQKYIEKVANSQDIVLFKRQFKKNIKSYVTPLDKDAMNEAFENENIESESRVEDVVNRYFEEIDETKKLQILSPKILSEMCFRLVERNDVNAAENIISYFKKNANEYLMEKVPNEDDLETEMVNYQIKSANEYDKILKMLDDRGGNKIKDFLEDSQLGISTSNYNQNNNSKTNDKETSRKPATRGRGRGRGSKATSTRAPLDASIKSNPNKTHSNDSTSLFSQFSTRSSTKNNQSSKPKVIYEISDSD